MSDERKQDQVEPGLLKVPLSSAHARRYFEAVAPTIKCVVCGHSDFRLLEESDVIPNASIDIHADGNAIPTGYVAIVVLECKICGNEYLFSKGRIQTWLANNPESGDA